MRVLALHTLAIALSVCIPLSISFLNTASATCTRAPVVGAACTLAATLGATRSRLHELIAQDIGRMFVAQEQRTHLRFWVL